MVDARSRWCLFCDAEVHSGARHGPRVRLSDYVDDLVARSDRGEATRVYAHETRVARVSHARRVQLPNGHEGLALVVTLGDARGATPSFLHFTQGHARDAERLEGEVKGLSAHALIDLTEDADHIGRHRMLLEESRGLGRTAVTLLMRSEMRAISTGRDERFRDPETGNMNQVRPTLEVWPQQSRQLEEALAHGSFGPVELFDTRRVPEFDEQPDFTVKRHILRVQVHPAEGRTWGEALDNLRVLGREQGYGMMRVNWRLPAGDVGSSEMHTDIADIGKALLAHRELVEVENPMSECTHRLNDEFIEAMAAHFA